MDKNLKKEEKITFILIEELLEERLSKHEQTILTFISDNNKLLHEKNERMKKGKSRCDIGHSGRKSQII